MTADDRDHIVDRALRQALTPADAAPATAACLDAEAVAAWMDGGLDQVSVALAEDHVSSCARCQALVATSIKTVPATATAGAPARATLWRWWLAPLAAGVAATTLWMVVPGPQPVRPEAKNVALAPSPDAPIETPAAAAPAASAIGRVMPEATTADSALRDAAPKLEEPSLGKQAAPAREDARLEARAAEQEAPAAAADRVAAAPATAAAPPATAAAAPAERANAEQAMVGLRQQAVPFEVLSPDPAVRWRPGFGGVERSTDGGTSWERFAAGAASDIIAGSAPSPTVCWLVGRAGAVRLTVDGRTFSTIAFPEVIDLVGVRATDARSAAVTTADGRTFITADGGNTWRAQ